MCRYCKKLKQIKDLREEQLQDCIDSWKRRDKQARILVSKLYGMLLYDGVDVIFVCKEVDDFLNTEWIGK